MQIQDGQNFDPTKAGYSSISFGGRFGRTARINVDGVDVSDETVGTTTADIPASAIDEFQLSQSSLDLSQDLTSSGAVNVITKSGTNTLHGEAFGFIRDHSMAARAAGGNDFYSQRDQYGARLGGPAIKNKLFFFGDGERTKQASFAPVVLAGTPFADVGTGFNSPFIEDNLLGKLDYNLGNGAKAFYRYSYFKNSLLATFGLGFSVYDNKDITRQHVVGFDFSSGSFTHSIRFTYLKFQNQIVDATLGNNALPFCCTGLEFRSGSFFAGPNLLAPQSTPQSNRQIKYDGSKIYHTHTLRYGVSFNHVQGGGFADFFGTAPVVRWTTSAGNPDDPSCAGHLGDFTDPCPGSTEDFANHGSLPGGDTNPLNYPVNRIQVGNGQGFNTLQPALGFPAGGLGPDNRIGLYVGDTWKIRPNLTVSLGLRYDRDTGRTDSDLGAISEINDAFPGFIRDSNGNATTTSPKGICGNDVHIGDVVPQILDFWQQVLAGNTFDTSAINPNFVGTSLLEGLGVPGPALFAPNYQTPRSVQINFGIQREIRHGMLFTADYLRNIETHTLLAIDVNKVGDISTFSAAGANQAINDTNAAFGCPAGPGAGVDCAIAAGATIDDYVFFGLGTPNDAFGVGCNQPVLDSKGNPTGGLGHPCAFGGVNSNQNQAFFLKPIGRSVYNALQMKLTQNVNNPFRGVKAVNFQIAYSLSNFSNTGGAQATGTSGDSDQDFVLSAADNNRPGRYYGVPTSPVTAPLAIRCQARIWGSLTVARTPVR